MDLWDQLLQEIAKAGPNVKWMHAPSHVGIQGNINTDTLVDMGRREHVTTARK